MPAAEEATDVSTVQAFCVGCEFGPITSVQNPGFHLHHSCRNTVFNGGFYDASFMEAADCGVIYSAGDPTILGTVFNGPEIHNIPPFTSNPRMLPSGRIGIYIDNTGSGVTVRDAMFVNCNSSDGGSPPMEVKYCVQINGGQGNLIDGVRTINCVSIPVGILTWTDFGASNPWDHGSANPYAYNNIVRANLADGRYRSLGGELWGNFLATTPYLGAPRSNAIYRVWPDVNSSPQPNWNQSPDLAVDGVSVSVDQPQGAVGSLTEPPFPPPPSW